MDSENLLVGKSSNARRIYLVDFGLSTVHGSTEFPFHIHSEGKFEELPSKFASANAHLGLEQSKKDDLESLGYLLIYFIRGNLPWQSVDVRTGGEKVAEMKRAIVAELRGKEIYSKG